LKFNSRNEPIENKIDEETKVTLNDINQLKTRVKSIGITFNEMKAIQVNRIFLRLFVLFLSNSIFLEYSN
jgi:hypothetical protein